MNAWEVFFVVMCGVAATVFVIGWAWMLDSDYAEEIEL